ncbi:hypothetical protein CBM2637_A30036 [Cupriavidus taiwanensis]|nr:hypothetical protein CBM2637_A30036 [Cupriavidus taiwanensis]
MAFYFAIVAPVLIFVQAYSSLKSRPIKLPDGISVDPRPPCSPQVPLAY